MGGSRVVGVMGVEGQGHLLGGMMTKPTLDEKKRHVGQQQIRIKRYVLIVIRLRFVLIAI
jgi:hypothetical protein